MTTILHILTLTYFCANCYFTGKLHAGYDEVNAERPVMFWPAMLIAGTILWIIVECIFGRKDGPWKDFT